MGVGNLWLFQVFLLVLVCLYCLFDVWWWFSALWTLINQSDWHFLPVEMGNEYNAYLKLIDNESLFYCRLHKFMKIFTNQPERFSTIASACSGWWSHRASQKFSKENPFRVGWNHHGLQGQSVLFGGKIRVCTNGMCPHVCLLSLSLSSFSSRLFHQTFGFLCYFKMSKMCFYSSKIRFLLLIISSSTILFFVFFAPL